MISKNAVLESRTVVHISGGKFPGQSAKPRYYLVISDFSKIPANEIFVCLPLTTSEVDYDPFMIRIDERNMETGSIRPGYVVCDNIFTFLKSDVDSIRGKVTLYFYSTVTKKLKNSILKL